MIDVVCGLIRDGLGRVLACRRPDGKHLGGLWEFPGGKVEIGENPVDSLVRELREELGIGVEVSDALSPVEWDYGNVSIRLLPFFCTISDGEPIPAEHSEIRWCALEALGQLDWAAADVPVIAEVLEISGFRR